MKSTTTGRAGGFMKDVEIVLRRAFGDRHAKSQHVGVEIGGVLFRGTPLRIAVERGVFSLAGYL